MDEVVTKLLSEKPIIVPRLLLSNYRRLNISEEELIIIIMLMDKGNKVIYDPIHLADEINVDKMMIMEIISNLVDKNVLSLVTEKCNRKTLQYISLDLLYKKLTNTLIDVSEEEVEVSGSVFEKFEQELGKTLSPMQYEQIKEWITSGVSEELIIEALKEAVINGINNFRYIDVIISKWMEKGYKTKNDILKDKELYRSKRKKNVQEVYDMDWVNLKDE